MIASRHVRNDDYGDLNDGIRDDESEDGDVEQTKAPIFWKTNNCRASSQLESMIQESSLTGPKSTSVLYALVALDMAVNSMEVEH